jgi:prepilin-type N-terminal cleavage/methylation domain-containing protein
MAIRRSFTLIEVIFVIVVIAILAAVAIPKFKDLKLNATISSVIATYKSVIDSVHSIYLNETEFNGKDKGELRITDFIKIVGTNCPQDQSLRQNCWYRYTRPELDYLYYHIVSNRFEQLCLLSLHPWRIEKG